VAPEGPPSFAEEQGPDRQAPPGSLKRRNGLRDGGEIGSAVVPVRPWDRRVREWDGGRGGRTPAESVGREGLTFLTTALGPEHPEVAGATVAYADYVAQDRTRYAEAEALYRRGLAIQRQDDSVAEQLMAEGLALRRRGHGLRHALVGLALVQLGELNTRKKDYAIAEHQLLEAWDILQALMDTTHPQVREGRAALVALYEAWNRPEDAARYRGGQ